MTNPFDPAQLASNIAFTAAKKIPKKVDSAVKPKKSLVEFGDSIKEKHPEYNDMDSAELGKKMLVKYPEYNDIVMAEEPNEGLNMATNIGLGAGAATAGLATLQGAGALNKRLGKAIYGLTIQPTQSEAEAIQSYNAGVSNVKPKTAVDTALETPLLQKGGRSLSSKLGMIGTRAQIGTQAEAKASDIFKTTVNPLLKKSKTTVNVQGAIKELRSGLEKLAKKDPDKIAEYKEALKQLGDSFSDASYNNMKLEDLQTLKSGLQGRTPQKFFKGQEITNAYQEVRALLSSKLAGKLHSALSKEHGVKSADIYKDWANLKGLSKIGPKALTQAGRKGGSGGLVSWIMDELATPITTTLGKLIYKSGEVAEALPKALAKGGKALIKGGKVFSLLDDGTIIPGSPTNIAGKATIYYNPKDWIKLKGGNEVEVSKDGLKYNESLNKKVVQTDFGFVDEEGNLYN